jgi:hypothetical protein
MTAKDDNFCLDDDNSDDESLNRQHQFETDASYSILSPEFCNICLELIVSLFGVVQRCRLCDFVCHDVCSRGAPPTCTISLADSLVKDETVRKRVIDAHHWLRGNVRASECDVCQESLSAFTDSADALSCSRCKLAVHQRCKSSLENCACKPLHSRLLWLNSPDAANDSTRTPLACFVNARSGGGQGYEIAKQVC